MYPPPVVVGGVVVVVGVGLGFVGRLFAGGCVWCGVGCGFCCGAD